MQSVFSLDKLAQSYLSKMTHNKIVRSEKTSIRKVSRSGEIITDNKTVRSEKQRLLSQPNQVVDGR